MNRAPFAASVLAVVDVEALHQDAADASAELEARVRAAPDDAEGWAALGASLRDLAAGTLLAQGDVAAFQATLRRTAEARLALLREPVPPPGSATRRFFGKGQSDGLVAAIVGEDAALARTLADASPRALLARVELEEDFYEASLLEHLVRHDPRSAPPAARASAEADQAALAALGELSPRARTFAALAIERGEGFEDAWDAWADASASAHAAAGRQLRRAPRRDFVEAAIWFDGLAALRFALALGRPLPEPDAGLPELVLRTLTAWSWV